MLMSHAEIQLRHHLADHFKDVCFVSLEFQPEFKLSSGISLFPGTSAFVHRPTATDVSAVNLCVHLSAFCV